MNPTAIAEIELHKSPTWAIRAWTEPELLSGWMFGPVVRDEIILQIQTDPRPGGEFSFLVDRQGQQIDHVGRYLIVEPACRLHFTWAIGEIKPDDSVVRIELNPIASGCHVRLEHEMHPDWADYVDRCRESWGKMLASLARLAGEQ